MICLLSCGGGHIISLFTVFSWFVVFFFFQAEDGIRDDLVTGVQTCALPIFTWSSAAAMHSPSEWCAACRWYLPVAITIGEPSLRHQDNARLSRRIHQLHQASDGVYGSPRIWEELQYEGEECSLNRVARLMKANNLTGIPAIKRWC